MHRGLLGYYFGDVGERAFHLRCGLAEAALDALATPMALPLVWALV